jgi:hypothetical protein
MSWWQREQAEINTISLVNFTTQNFWLMIMSWGKSFYYIYYWKLKV